MGRLAPPRPPHDSDPDDSGRHRTDLVAAVMYGPDVLAVVDPDGTVRTSGGAPDGPLGTAGALLPGANLLDAVHPEDAGDAARFLGTVASLASGSAPAGPVNWRVGSLASRWRRYEVTATNRSADERVRGLVVSLRDIEDRGDQNGHAARQLLEDELTGLPTRSVFYDRLEQALAHGDNFVGVAYVDLDAFKTVNDAHGHAAGDVVLAEVARRLRGSLRTGDTAARLGGDEFGILLTGVTGSNDAVQAAQRLLSILAAPLTAVEAPLKLEPSVGVAVGTGRDSGPDELLRRADLAMQAAKRGETGRHWVLYDPSHEAPSGIRKRLRGPGGWFARTREQHDEVADVLDRQDALIAAYQPIIDLRTGLVAGYEALARFPRHPGRSPADFFAQAHRSGLGFMLEARAIEAALDPRRRPTATFLTMNVSPSAFTSPELHAVLPERLDGIVVEITEHEAVPDDRAFWDMCDDLRARGGRLAVDDAGAGYAGLRQLMRLRPDILKLDRGMVDGVAGDPAKGALIEAMVRYAREIGASVCAEGIETLEDLEALADLDVTYGQGWAIARPAKPWPDVAPEAAAACRASYSANLRRTPSEAVGSLAHDRRLEWLTWRLSEAASYSELADAVESIARELHADELMVSIVEDGGEDLVFVGARGLELFGERYRIAEYPQTDWILREQATVQVLVTDPAADPQEVSVLKRLGMASVLILPVVCGGRSIGLLEAYSAEERPWSRFEMGRARIIAFQVGAALERLQRAAV